MKPTTLSRAGERLVRALHTRKQRSENELFLAEGVRIAEEALDADLVLRFAVVLSSLGDNDRGARLRDRLEQVAPVHEVAGAQMARLAPTDTPQGVLLVAETPRRSLDDIVFATSSIVLVLDGVQDPGNFGTLVRSADAFAAAAVIALPGTVDPWNPKAVRAAAGSSFRVPLAQLDLDAAVSWLRSRDCIVLAADTDGVPIGEVELRERVAVVVGNEGAGLRAATRAVADEIVAVPIPGRAESLNVAVAAGILLDRISARR